MPCGGLFGSKSLPSTPDARDFLSSCNRFLHNSETLLVLRHSCRSFWDSFLNLWASSKILAVSCLDISITHSLDFGLLVLISYSAVITAPVLVTQAPIGGIVVHPFGRGSDVLSPKLTTVMIFTGFHYHNSYISRQRRYATDDRASHTSGVREGHWRKRPGAKRQPVG